MKKKLGEDRKYWKERDWEALQKKRKMKMDEAVRLLNNRTEVHTHATTRRHSCSHLQKMWGGNIGALVC